MTFTDTYGRRLPALKPIVVRPIEPTDTALYRPLSAAQWDALMDAKHGPETDDE